MASPTFHLINAFTLPDSPHSGNQAAVVLFPSPSHPSAKDDGYLQLVARDFNVAETAFLVPLPDGQYSLRWFTPIVEVELCGHATLAASKTLLLLHPEVDIFRFQTKSGQLTARRSGVDVIISLPIPALDPTDQKSSAKLISELQQAIGIAEADLVAASTLEWGDGSAIFELGSDVDLLGLKFDIKALVRFGKGLVIMTQMVDSGSGERLQIKSRVFAPGLGVDEDSVTGAAHAMLTGYYLTGPGVERLPKHLTQGKSVKDIQIEARQLSERGGGMTCAWEDGRARLTGRACEMGRGTLAVRE